MLKIFFAAGTVLTLLFGAVGVGAAAAQNSQPGEPLYALKAWGEPFQFMFQAREQIQTQTMNGSAQSGQQMQNQIRMQTQNMFQAQQMNNSSGNGAGLQNQDQLRLQTRDRLQDCQTLDPSVVTLGDQDRDQTQDQDQTQLRTQDKLHQTLDPSLATSGDLDRDQTQDQDQTHLQTQDMLHSEDCVPDPDGSAAQNQNGGPHTP